MKARSALAAAAIAIGLPSPVTAGTGDAPSLKTEPVLACLLGMARDGCENDFLGVTLRTDNHALTRFQVRRLITYCAKRYVRRRLDNCLSGPLESVRYLGTNIGGADVYDVNYLHMDTTYVISQPDSNGKIPRLWIIEGAAIRSIHHEEVAVTSPQKSAQTIYTRPQAYSGDTIFN
jgi:hypothetical protein